MRLTHTRTREGRWEGVLTLEEGADAMPVLEITHRDEALGDVRFEERKGHPGEWALSFAIPPACLSDGVETILITEKNSGERLGSYTIVTGRALEDDFRAELDLLRAELDMLKRAFRRHCVETMQES